MAVGCLLVTVTAWGCLSAPGPPPRELPVSNLDRETQGDRPSPPDDLHRDPQHAALLNGRAVLERDDWIHATRPQQAFPDDLGHRWRYPDLEDLLARPASRRPELKAALRDADAIVAANAAIALARLGDGSGVERLASAVRAPELKLPIRLAAAEALGTVDAPPPVELLRELIDQYGNGEGDSGTHPIPELHAELIRGLARHVDPAEDPRFAHALKSPSADVRLESLRAWTAGRRGALPVEAADLRADPDAGVRAAAMVCLARRHHPEALEHLRAALEDHDLKVRMAAIAALGELDSTEARTTLERLLEDRAESIRAAAVSALAASGAVPLVLGAASDDSWRVRSEVARALARYPDRNGAALARRLLADPSSEVRKQVIASLSQWPLRRAGPVLLAAMETAGYMTRKTAAEQLASLWPAAAEFPPDGPAERRAEVLGRLERRFRQEVGFVDPDVVAAAAVGPSATPIPPQKIAEVERLVRVLSDPSIPESIHRQVVQSLAVFGPELVESLEQLALDRRITLPETVYRDVLPPRAPVFAALDRLTSPDVSNRRQAAAELAELANERPLGRLAAARLASVAVTETDQLVWQSLLAAVAPDPSEPAIRLAGVAIRHPSPEVRRRACEHLAAHPQPTGRQAELLVMALEDESPAVARAAARALGVSGQQRGIQPLKRLLASPHESIRLEAAVALSRLDDAAGPAALERLSYSNDQAIRRQVAVAMGEIADPSFTGSLIRLLDDRHSIRLAALQSLPQVVGRDVAAREPGPAPTFAERLARWKQWSERRDAAGEHAALEGR